MEKTGREEKEAQWKIDGKNGEKEMKEVAEVVTNGNWLGKGWGKWEWAVETERKQGRKGGSRLWRRWYRLEEEDGCFKKKERGKESAGRGGDVSRKYNFILTPLLNIILNLSL
ncbi:hypothetical protein ACH5RR_041853 [Cinchona calisaya]|uniref:Uncharacterized protein n=1 Tax=Cinchona calisaya TaxID=153742 RepID=A0ABD2XX91_9GENT